MSNQTIKVPNNGHTLGNMILPFLFENGADFAACSVIHPMDDFLTISITASNPIKCIIDAMNDARVEVEEMIKATDKYERIHNFDCDTTDGP